MKTIKIGTRHIGPGAAVYVIAEAGVNHNGSLELALRMVDVAFEAGADAVKFQAFKPEELVSREAELVSYQCASGAASQLEMLRKLQLFEDDFAELARRSSDVGIDFLATPFDERSLDMVVGLGVRAIKIASPDLVHLPLLERAARTGLPLVLSTGQADMREVVEAVSTITRAGGRQIALMHCVSAYPAPLEKANLRAVRTLKDKFGCPVGLSDHTVEPFTPELAVAVGADLIEKHFTLDRSMAGPDHSFSLDPADLRRMVEAIRSAESALGDGSIQADESELENKRLTRRSLVARVHIRRGQRITREMLAFKRPGYGLAPRELDWALGKHAHRDILPDEVVRREYLVD